MSSVTIKDSIELPCGVFIKNRVAKAAMTERLANSNNHATDSLVRLYNHWSKYGAGLLISGNIMVDKRYKESAGNIVLEDESGFEHLKKMTEVGTQNDTQFWAQISHPGRQAAIFTTWSPIAPSAVKLKKFMLFATPKAMAIDQIKDVEQRFINTALFCKKAGFTGVQIHSAHGYLLSQFLAPNTNKRDDEYGGSIQNRSRLLIDIVKGVRDKLGSNYPISVKLNSADFQRGGFSENDSLYVIKELEKIGIDLLEISGGTYENITFLTKRFERESTKQREAYFMDFANKIRNETNLLLMITGGFRSHAFCNEVLENSELDMIGLARPFLNDSDFPRSFLSNPSAKIKDAEFNISIRQLKDFAEAGFYDYQIDRLAQNRSLDPTYNPYLAVVRLVKNEIKKGWFKWD